jgi:ferredoxin-NADP reductase/MOSC domain-containing protein YiiM
MSATIVGIFSGGIRLEDFGWSTGKTGYRRESKDGEVAITKTGIAGDDLADSRRLGREIHALYLFNRAHYDTFEERLGRHLEMSAFAENITYDGPDETELRVGDLLAADDVVLKITTPRIPCFKLRHFLGAPQGFPAEFSATGKTGFYTSVERTGSIRVGTELRRIKTDRRNVTIAELNEAMAGFTMDPALVTRVLGSPDLLPGAAEIIRERMARYRPDLAAAPLTGRIADRRIIAADTAEISIELPEGAAPAWQPGQFITIGHRQAETVLYRCYSLISGPSPKKPRAPFQVAVRPGLDATPATSLSHRLVHDDVAGDGVTVFPPSGDFLPPQGQQAPRLYIAGGIGITPILAHLRALALHRIAADIRLIYVARGVDSAVFDDELTRLAQSQIGFDYELWLTGVDQAALPHHRSGRPDLAKRIDALSDQTEIYVCGPVSMIEQVRKAYAVTDRPNTRLHFELFEAPAAEGASASAESADIRISGTEFFGHWTRKDGTLLDWIEMKTDFRPPAACRSGLCRTCETTLEKGVVVYPQGISAPEPGRVLLCCGRPGSPTIEVGLPAGTHHNRTSDKKERTA